MSHPEIQVIVWVAIVKSWIMDSCFLLCKSLGTLLHMATATNGFEVGVDFKSEHMDMAINFLIKTLANLESILLEID